MSVHRHNLKSIGVFDSGIGGLTVVKEIRKKIPDVSIVYFGDTARVPYGTKSRNTIVRFAREDIKFLMRKHVRIIISACFSVSSNALPYLKNEFEIPIIGMIEPGTKAITKKQYKKIGVIGTKATIESEAFNREIIKYSMETEIYSATCPLFVPLAEEGWTDGRVPLLVAEKYLKPLLDKGIEALILGCTHYPLLINVIREVIGEDIDIIEPGKEAALLIKNLLSENDDDSLKDSNLQIFLSDIPLNFKRVAERFLGYPLNKFNLVATLNS